VNAANAEQLVRLRGVSKAFPRVFRSSDRLRALLQLVVGRSPKQQSVVLDGIDLDVVRGESLGLIGVNGAGKSTLLKIITGVLTATQGEVQVRARIAPLLELGAGFHPEYTGRENIKLNAALLGMSSAEIDAALDGIIAFADIGRYIDEPVKHYSSGMIVRLGFAVVTATKPDLLITDEVLAVGDESFQKKCVKWIEEFLAEGGTLLLVSHSMYHIQKLCRHACWLHEGRIHRAGDVFEVTQDYLAWHERKALEQSDPGRDRAAAGEYSVATLRVNGSDGTAVVLLVRDQSLVVEVVLRARDRRIPVLAIGIKRVDGTAVYGLTSEMEQAAPLSSDGDLYTWQLHFEALPLLPGSYLLAVHAMDPEGVRLFDTLERVLTVRGESRELGMVRLPHRWERDV
jgi:lipopolysaccharide transport system ATP-binding protein